MTALTYVEGLGHARSCTIYDGHRPTPLRFVWHHVLPQVCGGRTVRENLASICDNCHYAVHALMIELRANGGDVRLLRHGSRGQRALAFAGYRAALDAGTLDKLPNEGTATG